MFTWRPGVLPPMPPQAQTEQEEGLDRQLDEHEQLVAWEFLMLLELGFTVKDSHLLVAIPYFTWHDADDLLKRGLSHEQAVDQLT
jgi:hypothetical protein